MAETEKKKKTDKSKQLTLKRTVTIKVTVTERFKQYLKFELEQSIQQANQRLKMLEEQMGRLKAGSSADQGKGQAAVGVQLESERVQVELSLQDFEKRRSEIDGLQMGSEFVQGTVDGFVNVTVGDNLYEKLGGMEILAEDGIVKAIKPLSIEK